MSPPTTYSGTDSAPAAPAAASSPVNTAASRPIRITSERPSRLRRRLGDVRGTGDGGLDEFNVGAPQRLLEVGDEDLHVLVRGVVDRCETGQLGMD